MIKYRLSDYDFSCVIGNVEPEFTYKNNYCGSFTDHTDIIINLSISLLRVNYDREEAKHELLLNVVACELEDYGENIELRLYLSTTEGELFSKKGIVISHEGDEQYVLLYMYSRERLVELIGNCKLEEKEKSESKGKEAVREVFKERVNYLQKLLAELADDFLIPPNGESK